MKKEITTFNKEIVDFNRTLCKHQQSTTIGDKKEEYATVGTSNLDQHSSIY